MAVFKIAWICVIWFKYFISKLMQLAFCEFPVSMSEHFWHILWQVTTTFSKVIFSDSLSSFIFNDVAESVLFLLLSGWLGYVGQWAEWGRAGEKKKNFTGTAGCTLIAHLLPFHCRCTLQQTCIPFPAHLILLFTPPVTDFVGWCLSLVFMGKCYTELTHLFVTNSISGNWSADLLFNVNLPFFAFVSFKYFLVDCSYTCFPLPIFFCTRLKAYLTCHNDCPLPSKVA